MKRLITTAALSALLIGAAAAGVARAEPASADAVFNATTLNLSAYGEVKAEPDMATVTAGVTFDAATAQAAMAGNRTHMTAVIAALKKAGIADKDIQTSNLSLNAQYAYDNNQPPRLTGYQASNSVTVTVNDLSKAGGVIDAVVASGANQVNGIAFGLKDSQAAEDQARRLAVKALQAKSALYAQATGYRVVRLVNLSESGGYNPPPPMPMPMMTARMAKADSTPVQAGQLSVRVDVSGMFELAR